MVTTEFQPQRTVYYPPNYDTPIRAAESDATHYRSHDAFDPACEGCQRHCSDLESGAVVVQQYWSDAYFISAGLRTMVLTIHIDEEKDPSIDTVAVIDEMRRLARTGENPKPENFNPARYRKSTESQ